MSSYPTQRDQKGGLGPLTAPDNPPKHPGSRAKRERDEPASAPPSEVLVAYYQLLSKKLDAGLSVEQTAELERLSRAADKVVLEVERAIAARAL